METPIIEIYNQRIHRFSTALKTLQQQRKRLGLTRLLLILLTALAGFSCITFSLALGISIIFFGVMIFIVVVKFDEKNNARIAWHERLININKEELRVLNYDYSHRNNGLAFLSADHPYAADLDLFGNYSLYQYINRCSSQQGAHLLATNLLHSLPADQILQRQTAAKSLSPLIEWRQQHQAAGMENAITISTENKIADWLRTPMHYQQAYWKVLLVVYPIITLGCVVLLATELISPKLFSGLVGLFFITGLLISRNVQSTYNALSKIVQEVTTLRNCILHFEQLDIKDNYIISLKEKLQSGYTASQSIHQLIRILNRFDYRLNMLVFFVVNSFLLWDVRQLISLNKWRHKNASSIGQWFIVLAQVDVLHSLATLGFNHPKWSTPALSTQHFTLHVVDVGHPLIKESVSVSNTYTTSGTGRVSIITGSNMAGKSTFLRSLGVNIVLAQMGAMVCANAFEWSPVTLFSSMRIADNLAENTSTFYAELKKLKTIIEQVNQHEKIFILLDEILRGTNSLDRHTGSKALVKQLIREKAVAIIATHDVALAELQKSYITTIENYHFDVQVAGEELYFDYKLKRGICQSMNASILMKKIGIEIL